MHCGHSAHLQSHHIAVLAQQQLKQGRCGLLEQLAQVAARAMALQDCLGKLELAQGAAVICLLYGSQDVLPQQLHLFSGTVQCWP